MARRRIVSAEDARKIDHLAHVVGAHCASVAAKRGKLRQCSCDLCTHAVRKLASMRSAADGT